MLYLRRVPWASHRALYNKADLGIKTRQGPERSLDGGFGALAVCGQAPPRRRHGRLRDQRLVLGLVLWLRLQQLLVALRIGQEVKGGLHLLVGAQRVLHGAPLIVVSGHDVVVENLADALLIEVEVFGQVGLQLLPQGVRLLPWRLLRDDRICRRYSLVWAGSRCSS